VASIHPFTAPDAPTGLTAPGAGQVSLSWTAPTVDGGSPITGYQVTRSWAMPNGFVNVGTPTQVTIIGLTNGTTYTFRVAT
jgi:hypothetical protein